jgi:hypothetical protein
MASQTGGFASDAFHETTVAHKDYGTEPTPAPSWILLTVCIVVDEFKARFIEGGSHVSFGDRDAHSVGYPLTEGPRSNLDACFKQSGRQVCWVSWD